VSRYNDISMRTLALTEPSQLPAVNWSLVGQSAPTLVNFDYGGPDVKLPNADAIVMTWTSAEWAAMDHVFIRSGVAESPSSAIPSDGSWYLYGRGAPSSGSGGNRLWGYYRLVRINSIGGGSHNILLFKSDAHLAHSPYLSGLSKELQALVADVGPSRVYSIGTAGGATDQQNLGDVAITNCATCSLKLSANSGSPDNGKTFTCTTFFPNTANLLPDVQRNLFYKLNNVATMSEWDRLLTQAKGDRRDKSLIPYSLDDLMNSPIEPTNLGAPKAVNFKGTPLLTTDTYFIAVGNTPRYAALEMDDAVIAAAANQLNIPFAFIRNISDAVIVTEDKSGKPISPDAREAWSSVQYDHFGVYSSFNGALAAWATLADW
jgi:Phosphorylase superfamily